jgi:hypothetical protein
MDKKTSNQANPQEVELQFFSSLIQSDHIALDRILTDDFILIDVLRGAEIDKTALLEVIRSGQLKFETIEPSEVRLRLYRPPRSLPVARTCAAVLETSLLPPTVDTPMFIFSKKRNGA